jgi:hypothetical protein
MEDKKSKNKIRFLVRKIASHHHCLSLSFESKFLSRVRPFK